MGRKPKAMPNRDNLYHLYVRGKFSLSELATYYEVSHGTVRKWLIEFNIPLRDRKEAQENR